MIKFYGEKHNHNIIVMLVIAALIFASMMVVSECRPIDSKEAEEEDDNNESLEMKWALDKTSTDEDVGMKWPFDISNRDEIVQVAGYGEEKLSTVLITGTVFCSKACFASRQSNQQLLQVSPMPISGQYSYCYTSINQFIPCYDHLMSRFYLKNSVYIILRSYCTTTCHYPDTK